MKKYILLLPLISILYSCVSTMKVRVDVLNKQAYNQTFLYKLEYISELEKKIQAAISSNAISDYREASVNKVFDFIDAHPDKIDTSDLATFKLGITSTFNEEVRKILIASDTVLYSLQLLKSDVSKANSLIHDKAMGNYNSAIISFKKVMLDFENVIMGRAIDKSPEFIQKVFDLGKSIQTETNNVTSAFGDSILSDPNCSIIAVLPPVYWKKIKSKKTLTDGSVNTSTIGKRNNYRKGAHSRYNFTAARTFLGNSDIAIKMDGPGEFTIKGVRVDADEAVRTSFKVLSQGIKYLAYANGIPTKNTASSPNKTVNLPELDSLNYKTKELNTKKQNLEEDINTFMTILIDASKDINDPRKKKQAIERIEKAYKDNLK